MNIKTKLENEELFCVGKGKLRIQAANKKGIYTIEDFLNCNTSSLYPGNNQYRVFKDVLSHKYLGTPLIRSICLDKIVSRENVGYILSNELGFRGRTNDIKRILLNISYDNTKIIDVLRYLSADYNYSYKPLVDFYISYYDEHKKKNENIAENNSDIKSARDEITFLTKLRDELDARISELKNQIDIEKRSGHNGRK